MHGFSVENPDYSTVSWYYALSRKRHEDPTGNVAVPAVRDGNETAVAGQCEQLAFF